MAVLPQMRHTFQDSPTQRTVADLLGVQDQIEALHQVESGYASPEAFNLIGDQWDLELRIQDAFQTLGIGYLTLAHSSSALSGGEWVKVYLAKILLDSPSIALLDEPSNHLDKMGREALYSFIKNWKKCLIVVSHDRALLSHVQSIVELSNQGLQFYGGHYDFYLQERKKEQRALEQKITTSQQELRKQRTDLQKNLERQHKRMNKGEKAASQGGIPRITAGSLQCSSQRTFGRIKSEQEGRLVELQLRTQSLKSKTKERNLIQIDIPDTTIPLKKEILTIEDFNFKHADSPHFLYSRPISFRLMGPKRIRVTGPNGAGKSTLIQILLQSLSEPKKTIRGEYQGRIQLKTTRVAFLDQDLSLLGQGQNSLLTHFSKITPHLSESERRIRLGRLLFHQSHAHKKISDLSGGERMRAALACTLFSEVPPELLILDEPTNNMDLDTLEQIESALSHFRGAMILISHDSEFAMKVGATEELFIHHRT